MAADIVPVLAAITGMPLEEADAAFLEAWEVSKEANGGRLDTKTFYEAVMIFRSEFPFDWAVLQAGQKAKDELDKQRTGM